MGFMDKLGSAANTAKWKADQQMRIMKVQNSIRDVEKQVGAQKAALADCAFDLFNQGQLADERLGAICVQINQLNAQVAGLNENLHQIQSEQPPSDNPAAVAPPAPAYVPAPAAPAYTPPPPAPVQPVQAAPQQAVLVCPECGQVLKGKFCPEHGVAGVPQ